MMRAYCQHMAERQNSVRPTIIMLVAKCAYRICSAVQTVLKRKRTSHNC